jgi:hypothetical protein
MTWTWDLDSVFAVIERCHLYHLFAEFVDEIVVLSMENPLRPMSQVVVNWVPSIVTMDAVPNPVQHRMDVIALVVVVLLHELDHVRYKQ